MRGMRKSGKKVNEIMREQMEEEDEGRMLL